MALLPITATQSTAGISLQMTVPLLSLLTVRYYVTFGLMHKPSICRLSVQGLSDVYDVAPYAATWTFRQYFAPSNSLWTQTVCINFFGKNSKGFSGTLQAKYKRIGNNMKGAAGINQTALGKQKKYVLWNGGCCPITEILWKTTPWHKISLKRAIGCWGGQRTTYAIRHLEF